MMSLFGGERGRSDDGRSVSNGIPKRDADRSSAFLASIVASSDDAIVSKSLEGFITSWNNSAERLFGYMAEEAVGRNISLIVPDDRLHEETEILRRIRRGEHIQNFETVRRHKDGELLEVSVTISPVVDDCGTIVGASKIARDLRPRRRAEEELRRTAERYGRLAELLPVGVYSCDSPSGRITYFNQYAARLWGRSPTEGVAYDDFFQGFGWYEADDETPLPHDRAPTSIALREGRAYRNEEVVLERPDGMRISLLVNIDVMHGADGEVEGVVVVLHDISALKESERALRESDRLKDRFLSTLSHELRNPLAAVAASLEVMRMAEGDPETIEGARDRMERQTRQLIRLVDDLLDVSRITQEKLELRTSTLDVRQILEDAAQLAMSDIDQRGHTLVVEPPDPPATVQADPERMTQALSNLLSNAALYTPSRGTIRLTARREGGQMAISVADDGVGIPEGAQDAIFDMFSQAERSHVDGHAGLGMGLTLAKSLVELHGGTIDVESPGHGHGSTFTIRLPVRPDAIPVQLRGRPDNTAPTGVVHRVLMVDDNKAFLESVGLMLEKLGHEVRTASDGQRAVELAADFEPDVVLMDLGMPGMNGFEAARILQERPGRGEMTLVALTGWGQEKDKRRTREAGFDRHMVKPVRLEQLRELLNGLPARRER